MQRILRELADAVGLPDTIAIVRRWGGRTLYVPTSVTHSDALALTLGLDTALKLVAWANDRVGGRSIQLPAERNALIDLRNEAIIKGAASGRSQEELALEFGLTRQMVSRITKDARERGALAGIAGTPTPAESAT